MPEVFLICHKDIFMPDVEFFVNISLLHVDSSLHVVLLTWKRRFI